MRTASTSALDGPLILLFRKKVGFLLIASRRRLSRLSPEDARDCSHKKPAAYQQVMVAGPFHHRYDLILKAS